MTLTHPRSHRSQRTSVSARTEILIWPFTGRLHDVLGQLINGNASLSVDATDPLSGVRSIEIDVDGRQQVFAQQSATACDACELSTDYMLPSANYATGLHTVAVQVTDYAGNATTQQWSVVVNNAVSLQLPCTDVNQAVNFPIFDSGPSVDGLMRSDIARDCEVPAAQDAATGYRRMDSLTFLYGSCDANATDPSTTDSGCSPPVEVQSWPACERNRAQYDIDPDGTPPPRQDLTIRGVPASFYMDDTPPRLEVYSGSSTIVILGPDRQTEIDFANSLVPVDPNPWLVPNLVPSVPSLLGQLGAPVDGALTGLLAC